MDSKKIALKVVKKCQDKLAEGLIILNMHECCNFCDYFVILSGSSKPHIKAISEAIEEDLAKYKIKPLASATEQVESGWIILDYLCVIVHIFYKPMREFYSLEYLWQDASQVKIPRDLNERI